MPENDKENEYRVPLTEEQDQGDTVTLSCTAKTSEDQESRGDVSISEEELKSLCEQHVCPKCEVKQEADDIRLRTMAEAENIKRRLTREMEEFRKFASEAVLADLLPVLDNLDLALAHGKSMEACKDFVTGVEMTRKIFLDTLKHHGLEAAGAPGDAFDPNFHEAIGAAQNPDLPEDTVVQVLQNGYILKGRLLRPAKVMVNKFS
ncbi:MAG: nucleotide exchange factor GrpE [Desulfovibrionaceae bacterium]